jgi:hypothetical protein
MSCIGYRRPLTGVLDRVMVVVLLGCVGQTAGLAFGTLFAGNQSVMSLFPGHGPATKLGVTIVEPPKSSFTFPARFTPAPVLVRLTREAHHPGVRAVALGQRVVELSTKPFSPEGRSFVCMARRRYCDDYTADWLALRKAVELYVMGAGEGTAFKVIWHGIDAPGRGTDAPGCGRHTCGGVARLPGGSYVVWHPLRSDVLFGLLAGLSGALGFLVAPRSRLTAAHLSGQPSARFRNACGARTTCGLRDLRQGRVGLRASWRSRARRCGR